MRIRREREAGAHLAADAIRPLAYTRRPPVAILGVPFDHISMAEAIEQIEQWIASGRPHQLVTANVDFVVQAQRDVELRRILLDADLVLCDGTPLLWASRLLGSPLPERVAGADLVPRLLGVAAARGYRVFFLGGSEESSREALVRLRQLHPELVIAGSCSPPFGPVCEMDHDAICRRIRGARPDILLVSFGAPKQEKWIAMHRRALAVPVAIGVGGTIDFLAGRLRRAPVWMQRAGAEWLFRLAQEPRRLFRRYARDLWVFGRQLPRQAWRFRCPPSPADPRGRTLLRPEAEWDRVVLPPLLDRRAARHGWAVAEAVRARGRQCLVDARGVRALDSAGAAFLARLSREARRAGSRPLMLPPGPPAARGLAWMHLPERFETAPDPAAARELVRALGEGGVVVAAGDGLAWRGEVTAANAERVWRDTRARVAALGRDGRDVALDLGALRFLDSGGVDVLLRVSELARSRGGRLVVVGLPPAIRRILELAGADRLLAHVEAGEAAPARLGRIPAGGGRAARLFRRTPRAAA